MIDPQVWSEYEAECAERRRARLDDRWWAAVGLLLMLASACCMVGLGLWLLKAIGVIG